MTLFRYLHWRRDEFERSIAEMGQSMGVTATGLLLLRVVDPEGDTDATSAFGYKQLMKPATPRTFSALASRESRRNVLPGADRPGFGWTSDLGHRRARQSQIPLVPHPSRNVFA